MKKTLLNPVVIGTAIGVVAPLATQAIGFDVTTGVNLVKDVVNGVHNHYTFIQWLQLAGQAIGYVLMAAGTLNKKTNSSN